MMPAPPFPALGRSCHWILALALAALLGAAPGAQAAPTGTQLTCHAASDAASGLDCSSIWLKQGIYQPAAAGNRGTSFAINAPVQWMGGYTSNTAAPEERATDPRLTVLSGDIDGNASSTSNPATVAITVSASTLSITPARFSNGTVGTAYSVALSTSGGTAPYTYAVTSGSLAPGLALNLATGVISGTPSASGTANFTITATDANSVISVQAYTLVIGAQAPIAGAVSATVAANSSSNPIALNLSGGGANSVAVSSAAAHGTATASGTRITYTPTAGYSGSDTFAYTATNANGTSSPATVTITVSAPILSISPTRFSSGTVGTAYSVALSTSGGTAPYTYAVTSGSLAPGLALNHTTGVISGTPSASGTTNFAITATDANGATSEPAAVALVIGPAATSTHLSATPTAPDYGQSVTLSAQVTLPAGAGGTVDFVNGTQVLCASVPVTGGQASCSVPRLPPGTATVQARYVPGDANTTGSHSNTVTVTAAAAPPAAPIPTLSAWGLALLGLLMAGAAARWTPRFSQGVRPRPSSNDRNRA